MIVLTNSIVNNMDKIHFVGVVKCNFKELQPDKRHTDGCWYWSCWWGVSQNRAPWCVTKWPFYMEPRNRWWQKQKIEPAALTFKCQLLCQSYMFNLGCVWLWHAFRTSHLSPVGNQGCLQAGVRIYSLTFSMGVCIHLSCARLQSLFHTEYLHFSGFRQV